MTFDISQLGTHRSESQSDKKKGLTTLPSFRAITPERKHQYNVSRFSGGFRPFINRRDPFPLNAGSHRTLRNELGSG
jgi:hypothetical protein